MAERGQAAGVAPCQPDHDDQKQTSDDAGGAAAAEAAPADGAGDSSALLQSRASPVQAAQEQEQQDDEEPSFLPPFANAKNKALHEHIRGLEQQLAALDVEIEDHASRVSVMGAHLKNVQQEIAYTESRVEAERREIETEQHLKVMADKEAARARGDLARLAAERAGLSDRLAALQASLVRGSEKLDQFKLLMHWNQEELEQWATAQRQKEEDGAALEKYRRQDEAKLKELGLAVEKLTQQLADARAALEAEVTDTQSAQIQLDRTAADFRALHVERQTLLRQWDEARETMKSRDEAIQALSAAFAERKVRLAQLKAALDSQAHLLADQVAHNRELEAQLGHYEREMGRAKEAQAAELAKLSELDNAVDVAGASLTRAQQDADAAAAANAAAKQELAGRRQRLEGVATRHAAVKTQLAEESSTLEGLEAKVARLEALRRREEAALSSLQQQHEAARKEAFRAAQALRGLRAREATLLAEISGGQGQARNLAARLRGLDEQLARQGELMYAVDYGLQEMERRVARAGGQRSDDEARALNGRIAQLTEALAGAAADHALLLQQVRRAEQDLADARRTNGGLAAEQGRLRDTIASVGLEADSAARALKEAAAAKEAQLVDHDLLKLQVRRLRDALALAADEVVGLEGRKAALQAGLAERRHEVEVHRDSLRTQLKLVRDDIHRLTLELRERQGRVDVLTTKYEALAAKGRATDHDGGEPKSQAYYVIKAAQEREELQAAGDKLDAQITQSEAEVAALSSTLAEMQATNSAFSGSLRVGDSKAAREEQAALRQQLDVSYDRLKQLRQQEAAALAALQQAAAAVASSGSDLGGLQAAVDELSTRKAEVERQLADQLERQGRAAKALQRARKQAATQAAAGSSSGSSSTRSTPRSTPRGRGSSSGGAKQGQAASLSAPGEAVLTAEELQQDIQLGEMRRATRAMLAELAALAAQHPDAGLAEALDAAGFKLPAASSSSGGGGSGAGSRCASRAGSIRSCASAASIDGSGSSGTGGGHMPGRAARGAAVKSVTLGS